MPSGRAAACASVCDGKAYVFAGRNANGTYLNDLWQYDPVTDAWTSLGATPLKARVNATMTCVGDKIYVGLGYGAKGAYQDDFYLKDWWEYTPATNTWQQLTSFPSANSVAAFSYVADGTIYAIYGFGHHYTRDVWTYSLADNRWTQVPEKSPRAPYHFGGCGTMYEGFLYYGLGYKTDGSIRQWYKVDPKTDTWTAVRSIPGKGREFAACAKIKDYIYIFGGRHFGGDMTGGEVMNSYLRYAPDKDEWTWCGTMPGGRVENLIAFSINGTVYFGLGEDENGKVQNTLYRIED